jgi:hypothetical protein
MVFMKLFLPEHFFVPGHHTINIWCSSTNFKALSHFTYFNIYFNSLHKYCPLHKKYRTKSPNSMVGTNMCCPLIIHSNFLVSLKGASSFIKCSLIMCFFILTGDVVNLSVR